MVCLDASGTVTAWGDSTGFDSALENAVIAKAFPVDGLVGITSVSVNGTSGASHNPQGAGSVPVSAVQTPTNTSPDDGRLSAGGIVGVTLGVLVVVLVGVVAAQRRNRIMAQNEDLLKHVQYTYDEDDGESVVVHDVTLQSPVSNRRVHVIDEDDSLISNPLSTRMEMPMLSSPAMEGLHHEWCSSPNCEVCEWRRQSGGVQFIAPETLFTDHVPYDAQRHYGSNDTVEL